MIDTVQFLGVCLFIYPVISIMVMIQNREDSKFIKRMYMLFGIILGPFIVVGVNMGPICKNIKHNVYNCFHKEQNLNIEDEIV